MAEVALIMAAAAVTAKVAIMRVFIAMAAVTVAGQIDLAADLLSMARLALQILVCTFQFEIGFIMVEYPELPAIGVVTLVAALTQAALMFILMTRFTVQRSVTVEVVLMATIARGGGVQADQREAT